MRQLSTIIQSTWIKEIIDYCTAFKTEKTHFIHVVHCKRSWQTKCLYQHNWNQTSNRLHLIHIMKKKYDRLIHTSAVAVSIYHSIHCSEAHTQFTLTLSTIWIWSICFQVNSVNVFANQSVELPLTANWT